MVFDWFISMKCTNKQGGTLQRDSSLIIFKSHAILTICTGDKLPLVHRRLV